MGSSSSTPTACNGTLPNTFFLQDANNVSAYYYVNSTGGNIAPVVSPQSATAFYLASVCLGNESNTSCIPQLSFNTTSNSTFGAYVSLSGGAVTFNQIIPGNTVLINGYTLVSPALDTCKNQVILSPYANTDIQATADANNTYSCAGRVLNLGVGTSSQCKKANLTETKIS